MGRPRNVVGLAAFAVVALTAGSAGAAAPDPPQGLTCSFDQAARTLTVTVGMSVDHGGRVQRVGDEIAVQFVYTVFKRKGKRLIPRTTVNTENCGAVPTVHNTDTIRVLLEAEEMTDFDISLEGGLLAPGATDEGDGSSEIEVSIEEFSSTFSVGFLGTPGPDWFRFGTLDGVRGVNLNAQNEGATPDIDARFLLDPNPPGSTDADQPGAVARTGDGDDVVTDAGGPEFNGPLASLFYSVNGGPGNDQLVSTLTRGFAFMNGAAGNDDLRGAPNGAYILGGPGDDTILGSQKQDGIEPGGGRDQAVLLGGRDFVAARDGKRDRIRCGKGKDLVAKDRKDRTPGCERKTFEVLHVKPFTD